MKRILFLCIHNAARSQMAEAFARQMGKGKIEAFSAGSKPAKSIDPWAVLVMKEENLDISMTRPKGFGELPPGEFDYVVSMGCSDTCPIVKARKHIAWKIANPKGRNPATYRNVRNDIEAHVYHLIQLIVNHNRESRSAVLL